MRLTVPALKILMWTGEGNGWVFPSHLLGDAARRKGWADLIQKGLAEPDPDAPGMGLLTERGRALATRVTYATGSPLLVRSEVLRLLAGRPEGVASLEEVLGEYGMTPEQLRPTLEAMVLDGVVQARPSVAACESLAILDAGRREAEAHKVELPDELT